MSKCYLCPEDDFFCPYYEQYFDEGICGLGETAPNDCDAFARVEPEEYEFERFEEDF